MNIQGFATILTFLFGLSASTACLPEPDFDDYNRPFYPYGGLAAQGERWVFVMDHRNDYFAADRTYDPVDLEDETDDVFVLHIEGEFTYEDSGSVQLNVTKSDDETEVALGTVLNGYMAEGQLLYIMPDADGSTGAFTDGFIGIRVSNECSDDEGWLELGDGQTNNYNWLSAGIDAATPVPQWGQALFSLETDPTILAAVELLNDSGEADAVLGSFIDTLYRWDLFEATVEVETPTDDTPTDDGQLVLSTCLLADMVSFQADDSIIDSDGNFDDSVAIVSRYGFFSADKRAVLDGGTIKKPKLFFPIPPSDEMAFDEAESYTGFYSEMVSGGRTAIFQMAVSDTDSGPAFGLELSDPSQCVSRDEVLNNADLFRLDFSGYTDGQIGGNIFLDDGAGSIDSATSLNFQGIITDFTLETTRFAPDSKPKRTTTLEGQIGALSGFTADGTPYIIAFSSDYCREAEQGE